MASVLIVDDKQTFADALQIAIDADPGLECVGIAHSPDEAVQVVLREHPQRCLVDLDLPDGAGLATVAMVRQASATIALTVLTGHMSPEVVRAADQAGASQLVPKQSSIRDVLAALRAGHNGGMAVSGTVVVDLLGRQADRVQATAVDGLTCRELEVLRSMSDGTPPKVIAARMGLSVHTVRGHVKNIYWKLDAHNQLEAVAIARRRGLITNAS